MDEPVRFEWDEKKKDSNERKHGISFKEAKSVFYDEAARFIYDPDHSDDEDRFILMGVSSAARVLVVCHCYKENENVIRIISARRATKKEQKQYESRR